MEEVRAGVGPRHPNQATVADAPASRSGARAGGGTRKRCRTRAAIHPTPPLVIVKTITIAHTMRCWSTMPRLRRSFDETFCSRPAAALPRLRTCRRADYVARRCDERRVECLSRSFEHSRDARRDDALLSEMDSGRAWTDRADQRIGRSAHHGERSGGDAVARS